MEQVQLKWLTVSEYRLIEKEKINCTIVSFPLPSSKEYKLGLYFYPEKEKKR